MRDGPRVVVCRGARATEERLLAELARMRPRTVEAAVRPLRVVVPSRSLRLHLGRQIASHVGAVAGVVLQTIHGIALEILDRGRDPALAGDATAAVLARRMVASEPDLAAALGPFDDGERLALAGIRDLLDAGLGEAQVAAVIERLEELAGHLPAPRVARAVALVRAAAKVEAGLGALGRRRSAAATGDAAELLASHGPALLPSAGILVHGFADMTGLVADLALRLLTTFGGVLLLDTPPDPASPAADDPGAAFLERLKDQVGGWPVEVHGGGATPAVRCLWSASDRDAEARRVAERVAGCLRDGEPPEDVAIVCRDLESRGVGLARWLERLGVPYSVEGIGRSGGRAERRLAGLSEAVSTGGELAADRWLDLLGSGYETAELRLALRTLGAVRLTEVAELAPPTIGVRGVEVPLAAVPDEESPDRPRRATVSASALQSVVDRARETLAVVDGWPESGTAAVHAAAVRRLVETLGWDADTAEAGAVDRGLEAMAQQLPGELEVGRDEWWPVLSAHLEDGLERPLGGGGAGVRLLGVTEARAHTFRRLFLVGMERGVFPRIALEDPLLPDSIRGHLASTVLPAIPVKARSAFEESYLFAQLVSGAERVECSWAESESGRPVAPSPLAERLRLAGVEVEPSPPVAPLTVAELALLRAERRGVDGLAPFLAAALVEGRSPEDGGWARDAAAAARCEIVALRDQAAPARDLPAYGGVVGKVVDDRRPWVTELEATAVCPWQAFVTRRLGVGRMPDPREGAPELDPVRIGQVVHRVLETVVMEALGERVEGLGRAATKDPVAVAWPAAEAFESMLADAAREVARENGLTALGVDRLLAARARPILEVARRVEWGEAGLLEGVVGVEVTGELDHGRRTIRFRADRVDLGADGLVCVDYKTGKPLSTAATPSMRHEHTRGELGRGRLLQAAAYARAGGPRAVGRYVYLRPNGTEPDGRVFALAAGEPGLADDLDRGLTAILAAREAGCAFPRVEEAGRHASTPSACRTCGVVEACLRDDSGFRRKLVAWMDEGEGTAADHPARRLWWLGQERGDD